MRASAGVRAAVLRRAAGTGGWLRSGGQIWSRLRGRLINSENIPLEKLSFYPPRAIKPVTAPPSNGDTMAFPLQREGKNEIDKRAMSHNEYSGVTATQDFPLVNRSRFPRGNTSSVEDQIMLKEGRKIISRVPSPFVLPARCFMGRLRNPEVGPACAPLRPISTSVIGQRSIAACHIASPLRTVEPCKPFASLEPHRGFSMTTSPGRTGRSNKNLSFHVSASYSAKSKPFEPNTNTFNFNPYNRIKTPGASIAERKKARPDTGQDAFFIARVDDSGGVAMGVADGVGGYTHYGIDSADFSHTLCENMAFLAHTSTGETIHPRTLLHNGYQLLLEGDQVRGGASTACVGTVRPDGVMMVANLGDSGFIILRHGKVLYFSSPQTHAFNTPYQLSVVPPEVLDQSRLFGGDFLCDLPKDAQVSTHILENGDVVIFATDGVWDNLFPQDVLRIVSHEMVFGHGWSSGVSSPFSSPTATSSSASSSSSSPAQSDSDSGYDSDEKPRIPQTPTGISPTPDLARVTTPLDGTGLHSALAKAIAGKAKSASLNRRVDGPFAKEVKRLMPEEHFSGGKRDDICVVCLVVVEPSETTS